MAVAIWLLRVLLALTFAASASGKLDPDGNIAEAFLRWGYSIPMMMVIGIIELVASVALLVPRWTTVACGVLMMTMVGSIVTHALNFDEMGWPLLPLGLIALLAITWRYGRRRI